MIDLLCGDLPTLSTNFVASPRCCASERPDRQGSFFEVKDMNGNVDSDMYYSSLMIQLSACLSTRLYIKNSAIRNDDNYVRTQY